MPVVGAPILERKPFPGRTQPENRMTAPAGMVNLVIFE
jgi:hypothetical protein